MLKEINKIAGELSAIDRYSQTRLINPESVLEHMGYVCFCALVIGNRLFAEGEMINLGDLMIKATIHDIEETITGDMASPTKYWNPNITAEIKKVEAEAAKMVTNKLDKNGWLYDQWEAAKSGKEGYIIALADKLAVVYKIQQETEQYGNNTLRNHIDGTVPALQYLYDQQQNFEVITNGHIIEEVILEAIAICRKIQA